MINDKQAHTSLIDAWNGIRKIFVILILAGMLTGCQKELYAQLEEQEGNEILALLLKHNISSAKKPGKDGMVSLSVNQSQFADAVELLARHGLPRDKYVGIQDIINTDKLISTPFEDRTRYLYGLSQEISETLSKVDGVMAVRVHLNVPESRTVRGQEIQQEASAAVFLKYDPAFNLSSYDSKIRDIVSKSIPELARDNVSIALFPAQSDNMEIEATRFSHVIGLKMTPDSVRRFYLLAGALLALVILSMLFNVYLLYATKSKDRM
ncbi:MAG: type III secretion system inner membrane ring lipoprotein SctJ [Gammaproteobacteria bacterium]